MTQIGDGTDDPGEVWPFARLDQDFTPMVTHYSRRQLGTALRAMYEEIAQQPLPERFVELLAGLDAKKQEPS